MATSLGSNPKILARTQKNYLKPKPVPKNPEDQPEKVYTVINIARFFLII